ncbi:MAG TPA: hypothetical protein VHE78_11015 [Gemmatimonadaceae bacterium]|nr:hypothetical protein [Gemmatimonadaceae bacterium]
MRHLRAVLLLFAAPAALVSQQNPFKLAKSSLGSYEVISELTGDMKGTIVFASDGERTVRHSIDSTKMMGKTSRSESWSLTTRDSMWTADLTKKTGTVMPNVLPRLASAFDKLDGDSKKRFEQNMAEMSSMMSRAFDLSQLNPPGEKLGTRTYAGQQCVEQTFGSFTICRMEKAPIVLHASASIVCLNYAETVTSLKFGSASPDLFTPPSGVTFKTDPKVMQNADSMASGWVGYLSSKALSDSLAKAKAKLEESKAKLQEAKAKQAQSGQPAQPDKLTPEQQAQLQQSCDMIKNFDLGAAMSKATDTWKQAVVDAATDEAKKAAVNKVKSIFRRIP